MCTRLMANAKTNIIKSINVILKIGIDIVLINLECTLRSFCHFPCMRAQVRFPIPYRFFSHFLTVGLSEMERAHEACWNTQFSLRARRATITSVLNDFLFLFSSNRVIRMQQKVVVPIVSLRKIF